MNHPDNPMISRGTIVAALLLIFISVAVFGGLPVGFVAAILFDDPAGLEVGVVSGVLVALWFPLKYLIDHFVQGSARLRVLPRASTWLAALAAAILSMLMLPFLWLMSLPAYLTSWAVYAVSGQSWPLALLTGLVVQVALLYRVSRGEQRGAVQDGTVMMQYHVNLGRDNQGRQTYLTSTAELVTSDAALAGETPAGADDPDASAAVQAASQAAPQVSSESSEPTSKAAPPDDTPDDESTSAADVTLSAAYEDEVPADTAAEAQADVDSDVPHKHSDDTGDTGGTGDLVDTVDTMNTADMLDTTDADAAGAEEPADPPADPATDPDEDEAPRAGDLQSTGRPGQVRSDE